MRFIWLLVVWLAACAHAAAPPAEPVDPDEMSAAEHRRKAAEHLRRAEEIERAQGEPGRVRAGFPTIGKLDRDAPEQASEVAGGASIDPGRKGELERLARIEREHAREHVGAAKALERFTDEACAAVPDEARAHCPLLGRVVAVEEVPSGVRLRFGLGAALEPLLEHARCHMAFAREQHYEGVHRCPLYLADIVVEADGEGLTILGADDDTVAAIRERAAHLVQE